MGDSDLPVKAVATVATRETDEPVMLADNVGGLVTHTLSQLTAALDTGKAVGEPIRLGDTTIIPMFSMGMGFGAGGGDGRVSRGNGGQVGVGAGGGGVKPIAVIIAGPDGVRLEPIEDMTTMQRLIATVDSRLKASQEKKDE